MHPAGFLRVAAALVSLAAWGALGADPVTAQRVGQQVIFSRGRQEVARYQAEPGPLPRADIPALHRRGGYLHPLRTPSGRRVTDDFPANHLHHHGIWSAWASAEFDGRRPDFWNLGLGRGRVDFVSVELGPPSPGPAILKARHDSVDLTAGEPRTVLEETWEVRVSAPEDGRPRHQFDLDTVQRLSGTGRLTLPEYHYGGLGVRGNWAWNGPEAGLFLMAGGETNRVAIHGARARWFWMGGPLDGGTAGVAVLGHPDNFRSPQPMRLHPTEPFFCFAPQQLGPFDLHPGQPYRARYRLVVFDGLPDGDEVDAWWRAYAAGQ